MLALVAVGMSGRQVRCRWQVDSMSLTGCLSGKQLGWLAVWYSVLLAGILAIWPSGILTCRLQSVCLTGCLSICLTTCLSSCLFALSEVEDGGGMDRESVQVQVVTPSPKLLAIDDSSAH
jgi:hypothetical protein